MMLSPRVRRTVLVLACTTTALGVGLAIAGCGPSAQQMDSDLAGKYRDASKAIEHVTSVDTDYRTLPGLGRTGTITIHADTEDRAAMRDIMKHALPAIAEADPAHSEASLMVRVVAVNGGSVVIPDVLGFHGDGSGSGTLSALRSFVHDQGL